MERIDIHSIIKRELRERKIYKADLARSLKLSFTSTNRMLTRHTLQVQRLIDLSMVCNYNFFREIADLLPCPKPEIGKIESGDQKNIEPGERIKELESENSRLKLELEIKNREVEILRQTLRDLVQK